MASKTYFENRLLPVESVALARFITDLKQPHRRFHDPFPGRALLSTTYRQQDYSELVRHTKSTTNGLQLTALFTLFQENQNNRGVHVTTALAATYELAESWEDIFKDACAEPKTRKWLEDAIEDDKDVFFVVGFRTFVDPSMMELTSTKSSQGGEFAVPVSTVAEAHLPGLQLGGVLDPAVFKSKGDAVQLARSFGSNGESIYAVQYCKLSFKWYSSKKLDKSALGKTKWKIHWGVRNGAVVEEDDVLEAVLEDVPDGAEEELS